VRDPATVSHLKDRRGRASSSWFISLRLAAAARKGLAGENEFSNYPYIIRELSDLLTNGIDD
jgi:hypothetical protein